MAVDLVALARRRRALWILPVLVLLLVASVLLAGGQVATPFLYTIF
jgi:cytochrome c-type biogenesis protein CcmH/NrfF